MSTDLSDPVMSLKRVSLYQRWLKQCSAETFLCLLGWYRYYCWPHRVKFIIRCVQALISLLSASGTVTCAVFDDLFPGLHFFGQETRAELNRGLRGSFPNFPHLWLQQNLRTWPRNILAKEMDLSRIWNSPRLDSLFWQIATKKRWIVGLLASFQFQISTSDAVGTRFMQPTARGKCLILLRWISTATRILKSLFQHPDLWLLWLLWLVWCLAFLHLSRKRHVVLDASSSKLARCPCGAAICWLDKFLKTSCICRRQLWEILRICLGMRVC